MSSILEKALLDTPEVVPSSEYEIEILRGVLCRQFGTPDQRNALIRIITQNKVRRPVLPRLCAQIGETALSRTTYIDRIS